MAKRKMKIAVGITGSNLHLKQAMETIQQFIQLEHDVTIFTQNNPKVFTQLQTLNIPIVSNEQDAFYYEQHSPFDLMVIIPLDGNALSKLANGLADDPPLIVAKGIIQKERPIVLAISTDDALGLNGNNLMKLMVTKHLYFVPFHQSDPINKPNHLISDFRKVHDTIYYALKGKQLQPIILAHGRNDKQ